MKLERLDEALGAVYRLNDEMHLLLEESTTVEALIVIRIMKDFATVRTSLQALRAAEIADKGDISEDSVRLDKEE